MRKRRIERLLPRPMLFPLAAAIIAALLFPACISTEEKEKTDQEAIEEKNIPEEVKENKFFEKAMVAAEVKAEPMSVEVVTLREVPDVNLGKVDVIKNEDAGKMGQDFSTQTPFYYEKFLADDKEADKQVPLEYISLDSPTLPDLVEVFSGLLNFNYIVDPRIKSAGAITMKTSIPGTMTKKDLWKFFEHLLFLYGAYCAPGQGNIVNIYPVALMPQQRDAGSKQPSNVEIKIIPIKYVSSKEIIDKIQPFLTEGGGKIMEITSQNSILIVDNPQNFEKIEILVKMLDKKTRQDWPELILTCNNVSATAIKEELLTILPILGFPVSAENAAATEPGNIQITTNERLQVLIASAANQEALDEVKKWVAMLDKSDIGEQERVFVYKVINSKAQDLLSAISAIFNTQGSSSGTGSSSSGSSSSSSLSTSNLATKSPAQDKKTTTPQKPAPQLSKPKVSPGTSQGQENKATSIFDVPAKIYADEVNNRLIVRTTPRTYAMIKALMERIDSVPAQVLMQVLIAEINLNENTQFGLEFSGQTKTKAADSVYGTNYKELEPGGKDQNGFRYWIQNNNDPENKFAYVRALAGTGNTRVLSSPQIVAVSHTQSQIKVGDQVPILVASYTDTDAQGTSQNSIQYKDTGIILNITPHVTEGGLIVLDLDQTVSDAVKTTSSTIDSPTIQERIIKTSLAIRNGGTLIVGGLIWEREITNQSSLPVISKIPLLASIAGYSDIQKRRVELLVIITGTVITEKTDLEEMTKRYEESMKVFKEKERNR